MQEEKSPTELYRHYDEAGELLYVGISLSTIYRLAQHKHNSKWFSKIATIKISRYPTREAALKAERSAIKSEKPKHNVFYSEQKAPVPKESVTKSSQEISNRIVSLKPIYTLYDVANILGVSLTTMIKMTEDGDIGYIDLPKSRVNGRIKRGVSGWQLLEYIDHLHKKSEQKNGRLGRRSSSAGRSKRSLSAVRKRDSAGSID